MYVSGSLHLYLFLVSFLKNNLFLLIVCFSYSNLFLFCLILLLSHRSLFCFLMIDRKRVDPDGGEVGETEKKVGEAVITIHCI